MATAHYFLVSGRVQGVFFRASTRDMARALGLCGWIRNRDDGCVEGTVHGQNPALNEFRDWLGKGPAAAQVERVIFEPTTSAEANSDFVIR